MPIKISSAIGAITIATTLAFATPAAAGHKCPLMRGIDTNHDGVVSKREVRAAADRTFDMLNDDGDRTLEPDELHGRMGPKAFDEADKIKRKGIDKIEYHRYVRSLFWKINDDGDRTLECDELCTKTGMRLVRLLR